MASRTQTKPTHTLRRWLRRSLFAACVLGWGLTAWWHLTKPLPAGLRVAGPPEAVDATQLHFLADVTAADAFGQPVMSQQIFDATLALIAASRELLVVDYFLFNSQLGPASATGNDHRLRHESHELREALLARHRADPAMPMLVLVDPINSAYGTDLPEDLAALRSAGIDVVTADLDSLRDSNPLYSALWRCLLKWWLKPAASGSWPNLLDESGARVSAGAFVRLLNFKADHRKLVITADGHGMLRGIITSANPHDASSAHSNVGLQLAGPALLPLLRSELTIAQASGWRGRVPSGLGAVAVNALPAGGGANAPSAEVVTEGAIRDALLSRIDGAGAGDSIDVAMFYLTDRPVIRALLAAARRGSAVRVILDPNKDAFGYEKSGLPNRQVAAELVAASDGAIRVRWYRTHGEQFHAKLVSILHGDRLWFTLGSANLTRRNIGDYNLEANVIVETDSGSEPGNAVKRWFDMLWANRAANGIEYTADVDVYADPSQGRYWLYRVMEATGASTF